MLFCFSCPNVHLNSMLFFWCQVDLALESGEYFLSTAERDARLHDQKMAKQAAAKHAKKVARAAEFVAPQVESRVFLASGHSPSCQRTCILCFQHQGTKTKPKGPVAAAEHVDELKSKFLAEQKVALQDIPIYLFFSFALVEQIIYMLFVCVLN